MTGSASVFFADAEFLGAYSTMVIKARMEDIEYMIKKLIKYFLILAY